MNEAQFWVVSSAKSELILSQIFDKFWEKSFHSRGEPKKKRSCKSHFRSNNEQ